MSARGKLPDGGGGSGPSRTFNAPAGFRNSPDPALSPGEVVASQYSARRELARTDSGALFEAWDMVLERTVVLKLAWRDPGSPSLLAEGRRCAGVASDAAAAIYSMGHHRGAEVLVGEFLPATSLRDQLAAYAAAGARLATDELVGLLLRLARAVADIHGAGFTIGDLAAETIGTIGARRVVFGRFTLGQLAAVGPTGLCLAPEVVSGRVSPSDPTAAIAIDLYGLGCLCLELALGRAPFAGATTEALLAAHARTPAPAVTDGPAELADLLAELCAKHPDARPPSASVVVDQLEIIAERVAMARRAIRVLVVDDDGDRVRGIWSAVRRANARAQVDAARDGREAAGKLTRDRPDVVLIDARLGLASTGMNALELVMFARGLEDTAQSTLVVFGDVSRGDHALFEQFGARMLASGPQLGHAVAELVHASAAAPRLAPPRRSVVG
ncbi:MAG: response regulator [Kofleriaceae bacterium]|jgi:CheY-like chemotaxis protein|nr:response regulator [Kofleriaceae bacterium]MBP9856793.1 response regulator [Kofleriaceae bacterium]